MENRKIEISKKLIALLVAGGITLAPINSSGAKTKYIEGKFVKYENSDEEKEFGEYVVKEGDNLSRISEKICSHFHKEISTKYWPAIAFLNNYPKIIEPGDIIIFPKTFERLCEMNDKLREIGWTGKYIRQNKVYGEKKTKTKLSMETVGILLSNIYGDEVCVDEDFIRLYLKVQGLDDKYYLSSTVELSNDTLFDLTEWIPTLDEIEEYQRNHKNKTRNLK